MPGRLHYSLARRGSIGRSRADGNIAASVRGPAGYWADKNVRPTGRTGIPACSIPGRNVSGTDGTGIGYPLGLPAYPTRSTVPRNAIDAPFAVLGRAPVPVSDKMHYRVPSSSQPFSPALRAGSEPRASITSSPPSACAPRQQYVVPSRCSGQALGRWRSIPAPPGARGRDASLRSG